MTSSSDAFVTKQRRASRAVSKAAALTSDGAFRTGYGKEINMRNGKN
jgi:hypothetical protein